MDDPINRTTCLAEARRLICEDRQTDYGDASEMAEALAARWSQWAGTPLEPWQVMGMLGDLKVCRMALGGYKRDSAVDGCGYFALAAEVAERW